MKNGDFLLLDFVGRIEVSNEVFDLTVENVAKKEGIYNPNVKYRPIPVVIGKGMLLKGVEKVIKEMNVGEEREFIVNADDAYGKRDRKLIKVVSLAHFLKEGVDARPGIIVEIDGKRAKVLSVSGGRVTVDFNHPLAGKDLKYWVRIVKKVENRIEQVQLLLEHNNIKFDNIEEKDSKIIVYIKTTNKDAEKFVEEFIRKWIDLNVEVINKGVENERNRIKSR